VSAKASTPASLLRPMGERIPDVKRIAVLRANGIGDFIVSLPALEALRAAYAEAEITLIGLDWHAQFLKNRRSPIDRVAVIPKQVVERTPEEWDATGREVVERLSAEDWDLAIQLHGGGRHSNHLIRRLGARASAGLCTADAPPLDRWLPYAGHQHEVFRFLETVSLVGATPVTFEPKIALTDHDLREASNVMGTPAAGPWVAIHPGAGDPRRRWPEQKFARLADALLRNGLRVIITGGPEDCELAARICSGMQGSAMDLAGRLSLGGLAALFARCALVISNDSGPLHVAVAAGASTVGIFWCGNVATYAPLTRARHRPAISWRLDCPVCGLDCTKYDCAHSESFVADVSVQNVLELAFELLASSGIWPRATSVEV
jgi:ADP-heptose:LPS heptosyltransferase